MKRLDLEDLLYPKFGGGGLSSGGGGGSGAVSFPDYMMQVHTYWLQDLEDMIPNKALLENPYVGVNAYNPDTYVNAIALANSTFKDIVDGLVADTHISRLTASTELYDLLALLKSTGVSTLWSELLGYVSTEVDKVMLDDTYIADNVSKYADILSDDIESNVVPKFEAGMRDVNAVVSSSFVIGKAIIYDTRNKQVAKYASDLKLSAYNQRNQMIEKLALSTLDSRKAITLTLLDTAFKGIDFYKQYISTLVESNRISIVAKKEEADENLRIDTAEAKWAMEVYQYGANMLASIGGGTATPSELSKPSTISSTLGGVMSGASMGSQVSPGWGTIIGAVVGGIAGYAGNPNN